jgi:hypothetical protein
MSSGIGDTREEIRTGIRVGAERIARFALGCTLGLLPCRVDEALNNSW